MAPAVPLSRGMPDSIFWHRLAGAFNRLRSATDFAVNWHQTTGEPCDYTVQAHPRSLALKFERTARRAGAALNPAGDQDTFEAWLAELRRNDGDPRDVYDPLGPEVMTDGTNIWHHRGRIPNACRASADRCVELEMLADRIAVETPAKHAEVVQMPISGFSADRTAVADQPARQPDQRGAASTKIGASMIDEREVARLCGVSLSTVRRWRRQRQGPSFVKIGALVRYQPQDVEMWIHTRPAGGGKA